MSRLRRAFVRPLARVRATTYADLDQDEYGLMFDPRGWLAVIRGNPGNAAAGLGVQPGDLVWLTEVPGAG